MADWVNLLSRARSCVLHGTTAITQSRLSLIHLTLSDHKGLGEIGRANWIHLIYARKKTGPHVRLQDPIHPFHLIHLHGDQIAGGHIKRARSNRSTDTRPSLVWCTHSGGVKQGQENHSRHGEHMYTPPPLFMFCTVFYYLRVRNQNEHIWILSFTSHQCCWMVTNPNLL